MTLPLIDPPDYGPKTRAGRAVRPYRRRTPADGLIAASAEGRRAPRPTDRSTQGLTTMGVTVCGIVGASGAGKTRLAERLVPALEARSLSVGYVKHAAHGFELDRPDSDSARVGSAGATEVLLVGPEGSAHLKTPVGEATPVPALAARLATSDVVLVEGFGGGEHPKIRVRPAGEPTRQVAGPLVLDLERRGSDWDADDVERAAEAVAGLVAASRSPSVSVVADGVEVPVAGFAAEVVAAGVLGVASALKGVDDPTTLTITVRVTAASR
jgi:molybdopterin-guanine dinucleotide biosynthesis adapter protein